MPLIPTEPVPLAAREHPAGGVTVATWPETAYVGDEHVPVNEPPRVTVGLDATVGSVKPLGNVKTIGVEELRAGVEVNCAVHAVVSPA